MSWSQFKMCNLDTPTRWLIYTVPQSDIRKATISLFIGPQYALAPGHSTLELMGICAYKRREVGAYQYKTLGFFFYKKKGHYVQSK